MSDLVVRLLLIAASVVGAFLIAMAIGAAIARLAGRNAVTAELFRHARTPFRLLAA